MAELMRVVFRVDSSLEIGTGHVMRCLTLGEYLRNNGVDVSFICRKHSGNLISKVISKGFHIFELELLDVSKTLKIDFSGDIESLRQFLKVFFDNLITDWIVKDSIEVAFLSIEMIHEKIHRTEMTLNHQDSTLKAQVVEWENKATQVMLE